VFEFVKLAELYYAGSHGMDIKGPAKASSRRAKAKVRADQHNTHAHLQLILLGPCRLAN
jgi:hypothetical protein